MRVLVTGASGFVGSHVVRSLVGDGHQVRALVRTPAKLERLLGLMAIDGSRVEMIEGDITDRDSVVRAVHGVDAVVHAAAVVSIDAGLDAEMEATNLRGAELVLGIAAERGCDPIVHVSTVAALFPFRTNPVTADHPVDGAGSGYGRTKAACERYARGLQDAGHPVVTVYPSGVIGPDDWFGSVNLASLQLIMRRGFPRTKGYSSCYVDVRDVASVIAATMERGHGSRRLLAMGTHLTASQQLAVMNEAHSGTIRAFPLPKWGWWLWAKAGDIAATVGLDLILTSDAYDYVFNFVPGDDSATVAATGVEFRPAVETFRDTFRWMIDNDRT